MQGRRLDEQTSLHKVNTESEQDVAGAESEKGELDFSDPNDPTNPFNWSKKRKWATVVILSTMSTIK